MMACSRSALGIELPQLRNALDALLRHLIAAGSACEWVDRDGLEAMIPQLNLALGPMTAGSGVQSEDRRCRTRSRHPGAAQRARQPVGGDRRPAACWPWVPCSARGLPL